MRRKSPSPEPDLYEYEEEEAEEEDDADDPIRVKDGDLCMQCVNLMAQMSKSGRDNFMRRYGENFK